MIPKAIKINNQVLPDSPGVYFYFDSMGQLLYVGKATSLKRRVGSYFTLRLRSGQDDRIAEMVSQIARIDYITTPTVIEALVLEANQIKVLKPKYNIIERDDKSFLYLVITNEDYPRPLLMRGLELERLGINPFSQKLSLKAKMKYLAVFGPYTSGPSLRKALDLIRRSIPWSVCQPSRIPLLSNGRKREDNNRRARPCFDHHIGKCPGVCTGAISKKEYRKVIRNLILFFEGKKTQLIRQMTKDMNTASKKQDYEQAKVLRNNIYALEHIQDVSLIGKDEVIPYTKTKEETIDLEGRIEAYDISNISGTSAVGSMVVFEEGKKNKEKYRKFRIKTVIGTNDVGSIEEIMRRRLRRAEISPGSWPLPEIMVIDGGEGQVNRVNQILGEFGIRVPVIGLAKGADRKQDRLVYDRSDLEIARIAVRGKQLFQKARDEAHRFAVSYHRQLRSKQSLGKKR
ncbi:UvrB/UvrC motif-containing protein [Patescibacteria group bacterium]